MKNVKNWLLAGVVAAFGIFASVQTSAQCDSCPPLASRTEVTITDSGSGTGTTTWTCDNVYLLDGYVFVNDGDVLTIEAGTVIKGLPGSGADAAALIVARGGQIEALGQADCPIIMTYDGDPLDGTTDYNTRGEWGGFIVLGNAPVNLAGGEGQAEGIPADNNRAAYGGADPLDNSGTIRFVSVRHGGTQLGAANEINGITLAGVGSGTTVDYIEVISNDDDGVEFFGGNVDVKHATVAFCGDDSFDWDQGYAGRGQFWFVLQDQPNPTGDRGGELDGDDLEEGDTDGTPVSNPTVYNWTSFGEGTNNGAVMRNGTAGIIGNSIWTNFEEAMEIEGDDTFDAIDNVDLATPANGGLQLINNCFYNNGDGSIGKAIDYDGPNAMEESTIQPQLEAWFTAQGNDYTTDPGVDATYTVDMNNENATSTVDVVPSNDVTVASVTADDFFVDAGYKGAFDPSNDNWLTSWTFLDERGFIANTGFSDKVDGATNGGESCGCPAIASRTIVEIGDPASSSNSIEDEVTTGTTTWTCDNIYVLNNYVFVDNGEVLTIDPGTIILGATGSGVDAAALIVARGGQIFANGTASCPITMTYELDPLDGTNSIYTQSQWGGLIVLGAAEVNLAGGTGSIEGIPATLARAEYGGVNNADNSGSITYVSVRHGGITLSAANEINGITLGGVGSGTVIDHVEVVSNSDDGIEFFGGTVDVTHAAVICADDDSFDWDQGWSGNGQYWFAVQATENTAGDSIGELDGDDIEEGDTDGTPVSNPTIYNWTSIASSNNRHYRFRNGSAGKVYNSLMFSGNEGIQLEDADAIDSFDFIDLVTPSNGDLQIVNVNIFPAVDAIDYVGSLPTGEADLDAWYTAQGNTSGVDYGVDYTYATDAMNQLATDQLDLAPSVATSATPTSVAPFEYADYQGAFDPAAENWLACWSFADSRNLIAVTGCGDFAACNYNPDADTFDQDLCLFPGTACDDGNPNTINDVVTANCTCEGTANNTGAGCNCPPLSERTEVVIGSQTVGVEDATNTGTTTWTCDNTYILQNFVFVESGATLTIDPGTVVKGGTGTGVDAAALIVARGGTIDAQGEADCPIIFTFEADPLDGSTPYNTESQWGGVIILGDAFVNLAGGTGQIEGIPATNNQAEYGGTNDADNSGFFTYCSIRHGGSQLAAANEINGLTLGGVGSGTTINHVEVLSNSDDGIEFFGGTVSIQNAAVLFCDDDSYDWDQGYAGQNNSAWFVVQDQEDLGGDRGGELDGDDIEEGDTDGDPDSNPTVSNWTIIGNGTNNGMILRNDSEGTIQNSLVVFCSEGVEIEDLDASGDSYDNYVAGDISLLDNCFWDIDGNTLADLIDYDGADAAGQGVLETLFTAAGNGLADPGIDYIYASNAGGTVAVNKLDVIPSNDVSVATGLGYKGAFDPNGSNWMEGWSYAAETFELFAVTGCTNLTACNYDASATEDDGSCEFPGDACDDGDATTANDALDNDCNCVGEVINGCTDDTACNYDATATVDDGSCEFVSCAGCTDAMACNYDATATIDDGTCAYNVTFQVNMSQQTIDPAGVFVNVNGVDYAMTASGLVYSATVCTADAEYFFKNGSLSEIVPMACGVDNGMGGFNRSVTVTMDTTLALVCFSECDGCDGCTDPAFVEFDPYADEDNGTCATAVVFGCTYADADNYDMAANSDDGSCTFSGGNNDCPEDVNGDGSVGTGDILALLGAFGTACP